MMRILEQNSGDPDLPLLEVRTNRLTACFLPSVGGRLLSVHGGDRELLWQNPNYFDDFLSAVQSRSAWLPLDGTMGSWANVGGSKTWPAPQGWSNEGEWPGPPDAVLDSGIWQYSWETNEDQGMVVLISPEDFRTGLQIERLFRFVDNRDDFTEIITFRNGIDRPIRWSMWEVVQVGTSSGSEKGEGVVLVENSPETPPSILMNPRGELDPGKQVQRHWELPVQDAVAKFSFSGALGRISYRSPDGRGISLRFDVDENAHYPDGGAKSEVWMQSPQDIPIASLGGLFPSANLVELEVLSPLFDLAPGESRSMTIEWSTFF